MGAAGFAYGGFGGVIARQDGEADLELLFMPNTMGSALFTPALLTPLAFSCAMAGLGFLRRPRPAPPGAAGTVSKEAGEGLGSGDATAPR